MVARQAHNLEVVGSNPTPAIDPMGHHRHTNDMCESSGYEVGQVSEASTVSEGLVPNWLTIVKMRILAAVDSSLQIASKFGRG